MEILLINFVRLLLYYSLVFTNKLKVNIYDNC